MKFEAHLSEALKTLSEAYTDPDKAYTSPATWYVASEVGDFRGETTQAWTNQPCHAHLSTLEWGEPGENEWKAPIILASNCQYALINEEQSLMYLDWIFDPIESPWRRLIESGFHLVRNDEDGRLRGFYFDQNRLKLFPFLFYKNFCVASRLAYEYPDHIRAWKHYVDNGFSKTDAFILASYTLIKSNNKGFYDWNRATGHHWPICPYNGDGGVFDYEAWTEGNPRKHYKNVNGCWTRPWSNEYSQPKDGDIDTGKLCGILSAKFKNSGGWGDQDLSPDLAMVAFKEWKNLYEIS